MECMFGDLDDDIFEEKEKSNSNETNVTFQQNEINWFETCSFGSDKNQEMLRHKYIGDRNYLLGNYEKSEENYKKCMEECPSKNYGFLRDIVENQARTSIKLSNFAEGKRLLLKLEEMASSDDHKFVVANLAAKLERETERKLANIWVLLAGESSNAHTWRQLAHIFESRKDLKRMICCLIKCRLCLEYALNDSEHYFTEFINTDLHKIGYSIDEICEQLSWSSQKCKDIEKFYRQTYTFSLDSSGGTFLNDKRDPLTRWFPDSL